MNTQLAGTWLASPLGQVDTHTPTAPLFSAASEADRLGPAPSVYQPAPLPDPFSGVPLPGPSPLLSLVLGKRWS